MKAGMLIVTSIAAALLAGAAAAAPGHKPGEGHSHADDKAYGAPGDPKKPARIIQIVFREDDGKMLFMPDKLKFKKGEQVRFQLRNNGAIDHEFVVGTVEENLKHMKDMEKNPDMEHDDPNSVLVEPGAREELIWTFSDATDLEFACNVPGHYQSGMVGKVTVR